jgi:4-alpha-glucanotransferase
MLFKRAAGVLLHPTSLPGSNGVGELGDDALRFLDVLEATGLSIWQMLPLGPTGYGDSPYQSFSAFAGNPLLISVPPGGKGNAVWPAHTLDFERVIPYKRAVLDTCIAQFKPNDQYQAFLQDSAHWLPDYALFMALKRAHQGVAWTAWERGAALREPEALERWRLRLEAEIHETEVEQFLFFRQYRALREACRKRGIQLMGDVPIYVAHDSADVWAHRDLFQLDDTGHPLVQAGVPPDYFSATGQLWGNPIYDWERLRATGYDWWIRRMRDALEHFDLVRVDHFRGFEAYWEVPGRATTAVNGRWVKGPGAELFRAVAAALGPLPIVAENLGLITPEVEELREELGFPGMSVLQFAFGDDGQAHEFKPHNFPRERVVYTGTHDNDTTIGWWSSTAGADSTRSDSAVAKEKAFALKYLNATGEEMNWTLIRTALASVANTVLIPMQDILGLGSEARMNLPGRESGNWRWRFSWDQLTPEIQERLRDLLETYER